VHGARMHPRSRGSGAGRLAARQTGGWLGPAPCRTSTPGGRSEYGRWGGAGRPCCRGAAARRAAAAPRGPRAGAAARLAACAAHVRRAAPAGGGVAGGTSRNQAHFARASATHTAPRWRRPTAASERRHGRGTADPAPVRLALRTPVCPCCVRGVLVRFVVGVCVLGPLPAARARAVRARAVRIRAGRVVRLYSVRLPRAAFTRQRDRAVCARAVRATVLCVLGLCAQPRRDVTCHIAPCW
jgi:hypothetical protein